MFGAKDQFLQDQGWIDEGWSTAPMTNILVCPCGHKVEDDGGCPNGHESPLRQEGFI